MGKLRLDLKVYIDKYGNQYNDGALNVLYPLYHLSNNVYRLHLVSESSVGVVNVTFQKSDGTITTAYAMGNVGSEEVDGKLWSVYALDIEDNVLDISEARGDNTLSFSFRQASDGKTLNSTPIKVKCSYSVNGELPTLNTKDYDDVMEAITLTFIGRNKDKVFHTTFLPEVIEDNEDDYYNVGFVYILDGKYTAINAIPSEPLKDTAYLWTGNTRTQEPLLENGKYYRWQDNEWKELNDFYNRVGNGYLSQSDGTYKQILIGNNGITKKITDIETNLTDYIDAQLLTINNNLQSLTLKLDGHLGDYEAFTNFVDELNNTVIQPTSALANENKAKIDTINETLESKATITYVDEENAKLDAKIASKSAVYFVTWEE